MKITCPRCKTEYELSDSLAGKRLECSECGTKFIPAARAVYDAARAVYDADAARSAAVPLNNGMKKCPFCAEMIKAEAKKCRFCGSMLNGSAPSYHSASAPVSAPSSPSGVVRVDTGENFLNRNRGCGDLIIYTPLVLIVLFFLFALGKC